MDVQATAELNFIGEAGRIRIIGFDRMARAVEGDLFYPIKTAPEREFVSSEIISIEKNTEHGLAQVEIDTHGGQIISYKLNGIEFISSYGPRGDIQETADVERGRWPQNSPQSSYDPEGFWPFHGILNRIVGQDISTKKELKNGQATIAFTGRRLREGLINHSTAISELPENSDVIPARIKRLSTEEFEQRLSRIDDASGIYLLFDIEDDGGVVVTQQMTGIGEAAPGIHPYSPTFGIESWRALQILAEKFGLDPNDVNFDSLKRGFKIPLQQAMELAQANGERTITFYLDEAQTIGIEFTPKEGFGKDSILSIWSDDEGRICLELLNAGFEALGKGLDTLGTNWCGIFSTKVRAFTR